MRIRTSLFAKTGSFVRNRDASVSVMSAAAAITLVGFAALAVDGSSFYYQKRKQQSANDIAALAAANDIDHASAAASANAGRNGFSASTITGLEFGTYNATASLAPAQRFVTPATGAPNAVRITMRQTVPLMFGRIFGTPAQADTPLPVGGSAASSGGLVIATSAIAARSATAAFAIGSRLAQLNGGVLNGVLGGLLGTNLSLSVMDYQALADVRIDMFSFAQALSTRASLGAATYSDVASATVRTRDVFIAMTDASAGSNTAAADAILSQIAAAAPVASLVNVGSLVAFGPYGQAPLGSSSVPSASISMLDLLSATAQIANGQHQVQAPLNLNVAGVAAATVQLAIGERPVGTSFVVVGSAGASVHTAQTRLLLTVQLASVGGAPAVNLPIYIELAAATATLASAQCSQNAASAVTLAVAPAVVDGWIGDVSTDDFSNFRYKLDPDAALLVNIPGVATVTGRAHAAITNLQPAMVSFSAADIQNGVKKTVSTTDFVASLLANLFGSAQLNVRVAGLGLSLPTGLTQVVGQTLSAATTPIDQILTTTLATLGLGLGQADTWVLGAQCGQPVLVN